MANVALYTARTGLDVAQQWMNNISNMAANIQSVAFKETFLQVSDLGYTQIKNAGVPASQDTFERPAGIQRGSGARTVATTKVLSQGPLKQTKNPLDLAIRGGGYIAVTLPNNVTGYTRAGKFNITKTGQVVTFDGYALDDDITIDTTKYNLGDVSIAEDGTVTAQDHTTTPSTTATLGNITVWQFPNEQGIQDIGGGIALETDASGDAIQYTPGQDNSGKIQQGYLEMSNVNYVEIMTNLIEAQHIQELNTKVITAVNEMEKNTNSMYK